MKEVCDALVNLAHNDANFEKVLFKSESSGGGREGYAELFALVRGNRHRADGLKILLWLSYCNKKVSSPSSVTYSDSEGFFLFPWQVVEEVEKDARVKEILSEYREKLKKNRTNDEGLQCSEEEACLLEEEDQQEVLEIRNPFFVSWGDTATKPALLVGPQRFFR